MLRFWRRWKGTRPNLTVHTGWRAAAAVGAFLFLATPVPPTPPPPIGPTRMAHVFAQPVALMADGSANDRLGRLRFLGGWHLTSDDPGFGGISSMHLEGGIVTALSDFGVVLRFRVPGESGDTGDLLVAPLPDVAGDPDIKANRDTESMVIADGQAWLGYEHYNQIWRYDATTWRAQSRAAPEPMKTWNAGRGAEAMVRFAPDRFLVFSEGAPRDDGTAPALLFLGDPSVPGTPIVPMRYRAPEGYRPTDATLLPDGRLLILNRRFTIFDGFTAVVAIAQMPAAQPGAEIVAQEIARFESPVTKDNFEAISITQEAGRTIVWIASDDNLFPLQRTLLLRFALEN